MRNYKKPQKFVRVLAKASSYYNIELVYCHPLDVDKENHIIHGQTLYKNKWIKKDIKVPQYIDINSYCYKYKDIMNYLNEFSILSSARKFGSKEKVYSKLIQDGEFRYMIPESFVVEDLSDIKNFFDKNPNIILKPIKGQKGSGIYAIKKLANQYKLYHDNRMEVLNNNELYQFIEHEILDNNYLAQSYISSTTNSDNPFDIRIRLEKNGIGKWEVTTYLVRIGSNSSVVSNISQGGSVSSLNSFLKSNYLQSWKSIRKEIEYIGNKLPYKLESIFEKEYTSLGIDLGLDKQGNIFLFEVNTAPGVQFNESSIINLKVDHYNYVKNKYNF